jgi:prolipoprotein diacylglyceryltransferase
MPLGLSAGQVLSLPMIVIGLWLLVMLQRTPARRS